MLPSLHRFVSAGIKRDTIHRALESNSVPDGCLYDLRKLTWTWKSMMVDSMMGYEGAHKELADEEPAVREAVEKKCLERIENALSNHQKGATFEGREGACALPLANH